MKAGEHAFVEIYPRAWSYTTALRDVLPDGRTIGNSTVYSATTTRYQNALQVELCDVVTTGVPRGTTDLAMWWKQIGHEARLANIQKGSALLDLDAPSFILQQWRAPHDTNGNPRRLQMIWTLAGEFAAIQEDDYSTPPTAANAIHIGSVEITAGDYHRTVRVAKDLLIFNKLLR